MSKNRLKPNDTDLIPKDLNELLEEIATLSPEVRARLEPLALRVTESTKRRRRILVLVQQALSQLRLDMKYLMFDLEATQQERDAALEKLNGDS